MNNEPVMGQGYCPQCLKSSENCTCYEDYVEFVKQENEKNMELQLEIIASDQFDIHPHGDEGLFPNHSDKDIWVKGFVAGLKYMQENLDK
jgi:hypothetical protein